MNVGPVLSDLSHCDDGDDGGDDGVFDSTWVIWETKWLGDGDIDESRSGCVCVCKNVECKGMLKETHDDNTICSFVVLFVLHGGGNGDGMFNSRYVI